MAFLENDWYMAAWSEEVTQAPLSRTICGENIVLFRGAGGEVCALHDRCCHRGVALSLGKVVPEGIQCGYHGMVFDGQGACKHIPGQDHIPAKARVRHFAIEERHSIVWLWLGDPEEADLSMVVDYPYHVDPQWPTKKGLLHLNSNYEMLIDNIMDLTHLPFVHAKTIGGGASATDHATARMETEATPHGVRFTRWLLDSVPAPTYQKAINFPGLIDRWQEEDLHTPCTIIQFSGGVDVAQKAYEGGSREGGFSMRVMHGIVPETEKSCHYFFSVSNGFSQDNSHITDLLFNQVEVTLKEDIAFCESQQALLGRHPDDHFVDLRSDKARLLYRRHLDERYAAQDARKAAQVLKTAEDAVSKAKSTR